MAKTAEEFCAALPATEQQTFWEIWERQFWDGLVDDEIEAITERSVSEYFKAAGMHGREGLTH